jgi:hypothetical protein
MASDHHLGSLSLGHLPIGGASPFVLASVWERDANGTVQRVPLVPDRLIHGR